LRHTANAAHANAAHDTPHDTQLHQRNDDAMSTGLIGKKIGMTSVFDDRGDNVPVTVIEAGPNVVAQVKRADGPDGYDAVQLGFDNKPVKNTTKAMEGHFEKADAPPKRVLLEFRDYELDVEHGDVVRVEDVFTEGDTVDVAGITKGKGFQGVVKRHGFSGVGMQTHGQSDQERHSGSIGASADPSRVFKGTRMGGRTGGERTKIQNLTVVRVLPDHDAILIKGSVPGPKNGYLELYRKEKQDA
jgi:large subunit ribosomal protein L3